MINQNHKILLWLFLTLATTFLCCTFFKILKKRKKINDKKNFSNPRYIIGAAIINMERAILYEDLQNFLFFARYAIRACLNMEKSYPPNEPDSSEIRQKLIEKNIDRTFLEEIIFFYELKNLPEDDDAQLNKIFEEIKSAIQQLSAYF